MKTFRHVLEYCYNRLDNKLNLELTVNGGRIQVYSNRTNPQLNVAPDGANSAVLGILYIGDGKFSVLTSEGEDKGIFAKSNMEYSLDDNLSAIENDYPNAFRIHDAVSVLLNI